MCDGHDMKTVHTLIRHSAPAAIAARATVASPVPICFERAMIRKRVRARAIAMFLPIASGIVYSVGGKRLTDLGWDMPSVLVHC
jgi:hypothetical protein